ncbi:hypothetical protein GCM10017688_62410 [Streptomyces ramulosus]
MPVTPAVWPAPPFVQGPCAQVRPRAASAARAGPFRRTEPAALPPLDLTRLPEPG